MISLPIKNTDSRLFHFVSCVHYKNVKSMWDSNTAILYGYDQCKQMCYHGKKNTKQNNPQQPLGSSS